MAMAVEPNWHRQTPALEAIDRLLVDQVDGNAPRAMVFMPPQEGKSRRVSCWYPLWRLAQDPTQRIAIVSYNAEKAERWGRWLRRRIIDHPELGIELAGDSRSVSRMETTAGGAIICVGLGGGITGEAADLLIIDDPIEGRADAESPTYRKRAWGWWESDGATRLSGRGHVVVMMTRWHDDDLAGRLLREEAGVWRVLRIPAIRHHDIDVRGNDGASAYHPDGELISVQDRPRGWFHNLRRIRSAYVWRSVYDQDPVSAEGNLFRRADYRYWRTLRADPAGRHGLLAGERVDLGDVDTPRPVYLDDCWRFVTIDLAASKKTSADWTVASVWAIAPDGDLVLLDRDRQRLGEAEHFAMVRPLVHRWRAGDVFIERGFIGTTLVVDATRAGLRVQPMDVEKDKVTRALPAANRLASHRAWWPAGADWLDEWCDELAAFPTGAHDDQVDTFSGAARIAAAHWSPVADASVATRRMQRPASDVIDQALLSATGGARYRG